VFGVGDFLVEFRPLRTRKSVADRRAAHRHSAQESVALDGAQLLAQAADGIMPWRGRPDSLKRGLIARVPPVNFREELP